MICAPRRQARRTSGDPSPRAAAAQNLIRDAEIDARGRVHVLYEGLDASGAPEAAYALYEPVGQSLYHSRLPIRFASEGADLTDGGATVFEGETTLYPVRAEEYIAAHREVEFELLEQFGSFSGEPFDGGRMSSSQGAS